MITSPEKGPGLQRNRTEGRSGVRGSHGLVPLILCCGLSAVLGLLAVPAPAPSQVRAESAWSSNPCPPGKIFTLTVTCRWGGESDSHTITLPQFDLPEGLVKQEVSSRSYREGDSNVIDYQWKLTAPNKARFPPVPITLKIFTKGEPEPSEMKIETRPLVVDVARWKGLPVKTIVYPGLFVLALTAGIVPVWLGRRSRKRRSPAPPTQDPGALLASLKEELNRSRVHGDAFSFLEIALKMLELSSGEEVPERRELTGLLEQVQYGGRGLCGEEMDRWHQRLKRLEAPAAMASPDERSEVS